METIMKKEYIAPTIILQKIGYTSMLCGSITTDGDSGSFTVSGETIEGRAMGRSGSSLWDDEE